MSVTLTFKKTHGFTIIELLIVVVVIAILAAITIVSYNGITAQAENAKTVAQVRSWSEALEVYRVDAGSYPATTFEYTCLGDTSEYPESGPFTAGQCMNAGSWGVAAEASLMNAVRDAVRVPPSGSYGKVHTLPDASYRGLLYLNRNGGTGITYVIKGSADCLPNDTYFPSGADTVCRHVLAGDPFNGL